MNRIKLTVTLLLATLLPATTRAQGVSRNEALQIAERFFARQPLPSEAAAAKANARRSVKSETMRVAFAATRDDGKAALYVVNCGENDGFVIVSADGKTSHPVLGWSNSGTFNYDEAPIQLKDMLEAYAHIVGLPEVSASTGASDSNLVTLADRRVARKVTAGQRQMLVLLPDIPDMRAAPRRVETVPNIVVHPLVKVQWNQIGTYAKYVDPYYDSFDGVAAGCVPTAMAQVMAFWKYPARGRGFHLHNILDTPAEIDLEKLIRESANGISDELEKVIKQYSRPYKVNFAESVYQWDAMGGAQPSTDAEYDHVAKLIFDCHVACAPAKMPNGRGTGANNNTAAASLVRYFGYNPGMQHIKCSGNENLMRAELDAGRPVLMEGNPKKQNEDGHSFVCDGYAEEGYFHFNFGWGGKGDGYYQLSKVNPLTSDFSLGQRACIGIQPSLATVEVGQAFINVTPEGMGVVVGGYGDVTVPATVEKDGKSYPVTKVNGYAFGVLGSPFNTSFEEGRKEYLTRITLPENVTEIGEYAFQSHYFTEVNLPASIRKIGANAFYQSRSLNKVSIPSVEAWLNIEFVPKKLESGFEQYMSNPIWNTDNKYEGRLYIGGKEATDIVIPACVKEIGAIAFCGYQFLNSVTMEEGVEKVGASAFERVPLKELHLPSTLREIGNKAFYNHQLSTVAIPKRLTRIGRDALSGNKISEFVVDGDNAKYSAYQGILYDRPRRTLINCPNYRPGFETDKVRNTVGVPPSVTSIRSNSFGSNLRKLTLPSSVRNIEDGAFVSCARLEDLYVYTQKPLPLRTSMFNINIVSKFSRVKVHVPVGSGKAYKAAPIWQEMEIVEDQAEGSLPPAHYDYTTDFNAIEMTEWVKMDGGGSIPQRTYYLFDTQPVITFSGMTMLLTTAEGNYSFELNGSLPGMRFVHHDIPTGIEEVKSANSGVVFRVSGSQLIISGLDAHTRVVLYSLDGRLLTTGKTLAQGDFSINLPRAAIIVVKAGRHSFKIHTK